MDTGTVTTNQFKAMPNSLLTSLETKTLIKMAEGKPFRLVAQELGLTEKTARNYMGRVNDKLEVTDKAAAVCRAFCLGILKPLCLLLVVAQLALTFGTATNYPTRPARTMPRVVRVVRSGRSVRELSEIHC